MDIGILNSLGYVEVIEITVWLSVMYYGKCWVDNKFKLGENKMEDNKCKCGCDCECCKDCEKCSAE